MTKCLTGVEDIMTDTWSAPVVYQSVTIRQPTWRNIPEDLSIKKSQIGAGILIVKLIINFILFYLNHFIPGQHQNTGVLISP
jgi:hypothetical protein